ncbi:MAG: cytochrome P450 [Bacteroidota bacterium]
MAYDVRRYPSRLPLNLDLITAFMHDLLAGSRLIDEVGGDAVVSGSGKGGLLLLRHADLIRALLIENNTDVTKARGMRILSFVVGDGLLSSEVPKHTRQRKLVLPAFHHRRLRTYGGVMVERARQMADGWREGEPVDLAEAMNRLALTIAGETLFGAGLAGDADRIGRALDESMRAFDAAQFPFADKLFSLPLPNVLRGRRARATIDGVVYRFIRERRATPEPERHDLLQMLLDAQDEETGGTMTDEEVRDEAVTLLMAGHETTANALAWTWALLSDHPEARARLGAEADALGRDPTFDDLRGGLPYTRQVFAEAMRLRPPAWIFSREAARDFDLDGVPVRKGTMILVAPYFLHRDERYWDDPDSFDPNRFAPDSTFERHKFSYLPFSAGRRGCIGEQFAWAEGTLILATLARRWDFLAAAPLPTEHGSVTLRPSGPIRMTPVARGVRDRTTSDATRP